MLFPWVFGMDDTFCLWLFLLGFFFFKVLLRWMNLFLIGISSLMRTISLINSGEAWNVRRSSSMARIVFLLLGFCFKRMNRDPLFGVPRSLSVRAPAFFVLRPSSCSELQGCSISPIPPCFLDWPRTSVLIFFLCCSTSNPFYLLIRCRGREGNDPSHIYFLDLSQRPWKVFGCPLVWFRYLIYRASVGAMEHRAEIFNFISHFFTSIQ